MKETANNKNDDAEARKDGRIAAVARVAADLGYASALWTPHGGHVEVFDRWRWECRLDGHALGECVELYCAGLPLDGQATRNLREFLIDFIRW